MQSKNSRRMGYFARTSGLGLAIVFMASGGRVMADPIAYESDKTDQFGTLDLATGVFSEIGDMGLQLSGLGVGPGGALYGGVTGGKTLYTVNTSTGGLTAVGTGSSNYTVMGSTTGGLYGLDASANLFSINPATGATSLIGSTGLSLLTVGLSTNNDVLYCTNGTNLYSLNLTTGAADLIGGTGVSIGALVFEDGTLYGGESQPQIKVVSLNTSTGASTLVSTVSGTTATFYGLVPTSVPEPASGALLALAGMAALTRRRRKID